MTGVLVRIGGRVEEDRYAGQERPHPHRGHVQDHQGKLGRAAQVHEQGR